MIKNAKIPIGAILRPLLGAAAGGATGYYATPHITGYADVPSARRISGLTDAAIGGILGGMAHSKGGFLRAARGWQRLPWKQQLYLPGAAAAGEIPPFINAMLAKKVKATEQQAGLVDRLKNIAGTLSIPESLSQASKSPIARGAGAGAGIAGIGALLTGLLRARTQRERMKRKTRMGMVSSDFLKYLLPALIAGGLAGSFKRQPSSSV